MSTATAHPLLVPVEVSRAKLERELDQWQRVRDSYRRRGYLILDRDDLTVDVGFFTAVAATTPFQALAAVARISFENYDLWAPSVRFVDLAGEADAPPLVPAVEQGNDGQLRSIFLQDHPVANRMFVCAAGVREYHDHPQHSGDLWLLHRATGDGRLAAICERLWRAFSLLAMGVQVSTVFVPQGVQATMALVGVQQTPAPAAPETNAGDHDQRTPAFPNAEVDTPTRS